MLVHRDLSRRKLSRPATGLVTPSEGCNQNQFQIAHALTKVKVCTFPRQEKKRAKITQLICLICRYNGKSIHITFIYSNALANRHFTVPSSGCKSLFPFLGNFAWQQLPPVYCSFLHAFVFVFRSLSMTLRYRRQDYYNLIRWREGHIGKMIANKEHVIRKSCKFKLEFFSPESVECFSKRSSNWSQRMRSKINVSYLWYCGKVIRDHHVIYFQSPPGTPCWEYPPNVI